jgi:hypothetical protein
MKSGAFVSLAIVLGLASLGAVDAAAQSSDLAYTTLNPCRLIDTRLAGGPIAANTTRDFRVRGNLASQGASASGCGIPDDATGAMINFVAVTPAGPGNLLAWAYPIATVPLASTLNYGAVPGVVGTTNGIAVPICDRSQDTCTNDLRIRVNVSATDVVADVVGYFRRPSLAPASCPSPPCSVAICSNQGGVTCATPISTASGNCQAVSQSGSCRGSSACAVCQGPDLPAGSSAVCSDGGLAVTCSIAPPLATAASGAAGCSAVSEGGACTGAASCRVCRTQ